MVTQIIPRKLLFGNPDKASPQLSPDGRFLSYLAPVDGVLNVWVGPADNPAAAKPVTTDQGRGSGSMDGPTPTTISVISRTATGTKTGTCTTLI